MTTFGHVSASYLLSQTPILWGSPPSNLEMILVIISGYILDIDLLIAGFFLKNRASHHLLPTHTTLFVIFLSLIEFIFLKNYFSTQTLILSSIAMFLHLILDDVGYWFCKFNWQEESKTPQIFWFYPFDRRRDKYIKNKTLINSDSEAVGNYFYKAKINVILELIFVVSAFLFFLK